MNGFSRRSLLKVATAGGAVAGIGGFSALSQFLSPLLTGTDSDLVGFQAPQRDEIDEFSHVIQRLTFGPRPGQYAKVRTMGTEAFIEQQLAPDSLDDSWTDARSRHFEALHSWPMGELLEYKARELLDQMTRKKILRATHSTRQLQEVMVDFWSDHFNIDPSKGDSKWLKPADDREVIRNHALGSFPALLKASALSPSMLWYLDGRLNRHASPEDRPNENYARELLELHTLGVRGGYTQKDVMEVARCLTGWTVRERSQSRFAVGKVEFRPDLHDAGAKTVLGVELPAGLGAVDLKRVIEIVSHHPSTARYLAGKLCARFISDAPPESAVLATAETFRTSKGDIRQTLHTLFHTPGFRAARGEKTKRPFHFVVSALRATSARTNAGPALQDYLLRLGHAPFQFPTPDGYPEEAQPWMATLLWRWKFAVDLSSVAISGTSLKIDALRKAAGSEEAFAAHLLGRAATADELEAAAQSGLPLALLLASPAFQTF